jgi:c-di-GMP-binding flagellar brake protein YcgR
MTLTALPSRRLTSRVPAREEVWVYWGCNGREDISRVRDISQGGLFLETPKAIPATTTANLHFLVEEGQIRASAVVRHGASKNGLGLKFMAVVEDDRRNLSALLTRLQSVPGARGRLQEQDRGRPYIGL